MIQDAELTRIVPICTFQAHKDYLTRVLLSPDVKHLATCSADHTAKVWNLDPDFPPAKMAAITAAKARATGNESPAPEAKEPVATDPVASPTSPKVQDLHVGADLGRSGS